jgi:hypothetical protein
MDLHRKGNKYVQVTLAATNVPPTCVQKWNLAYDNLDWKTIFQLCYTTTSDIQLRWFQIRLLHRILPTEKYLFDCKIVDSPLCKICKQEPQYIVHFFWECEVVASFWKKLGETLKKKCMHCHSLNFNNKLVIFGISDLIKTDSILNYIILLAKFYIYKCKLQKITPQVDPFLKMLKHKYCIEKYVSKINGNYHKFDQNWASYQQLLK